MDAGVGDYGPADPARFAAYGGDKTFAEDWERETGPTISGTLGCGNDVEVLCGRVSGGFGAGGGDVERGGGRGRMASVESDGKVKLLRHNGMGGARGIDGDDKNEVQLLRHSNGVLLSAII